MCSLGCQCCLSPCRQSPAVRLRAARSLTGHIPSGSTASREPKPPRHARNWQSSQLLQFFVLHQPARLLQLQEETRRLDGLQCLPCLRMSPAVMMMFRVGAHVDPTAPTDRAGPIFEQTPADARAPACQALPSARNCLRAAHCSHDTQRRALSTLSDIKSRLSGMGRGQSAARDHGNRHARRGSRPSVTKPRALVGERAS